MLPLEAGVIGDIAISAFYKMDFSLCGISAQHDSSGKQPSLFDSQPNLTFTIDDLDC